MSQRTDIRNNIVGDMQDITIANGFSMNVGEVSKQEKIWADWGGNENWPKICLFDGNETGIPRIGCNIYDFLHLHNLRLFHKGTDSDDVIENLIQDVKDAMLDFPAAYRGGFAWNTCFGGISPVATNQTEDSQRTSVAITFRIEYRRVFAS